jgi:hypothetical protein
MNFGVDRSMRRCIVLIVGLLFPLRPVKCRDAMRPTGYLPVIPQRPQTDQVQRNARPTSDIGLSTSTIL